jgi:hypothetical protein
VGRHLLAALLNDALRGTALIFLSGGIGDRRTLERNVLAVVVGGVFSRGLRTVGADLACLRWTPASGLEIEREALQAGGGCTSILRDSASSPHSSVL